MASAGRVGFCLDETCGRRVAEALRDFRAPGAPHINDVREIGLSGATDEILMRELGRRGIAALVTLDSRILNASLRRAAWRESGLTLFVLDGKWGNLSLFEQARRLMWWWPLFAGKASDGPQGAAWRVPLETAAGKIARIFAEPDPP